MNKILRAFRNSPPILVSIILVLLIEHCTKCYCCMLEFLTTMAAMVMIVVSPRYFPCPPFTLGLSPWKKCISEICRFAPIFQGNNCFRVKYLKITFTFNIYLGTSWKEAKSAKKSIEILTGWWKVVFQIFGTSWMLCGSVVWVNENIWEIFAPWRGQLSKKLFWSLFKSRVWWASVQNFNFNSHPLHVFRP